MASPHLSDARSCPHRQALAYAAEKHFKASSRYKSIFVATEEHEQGGLSGGNRCQSFAFVGKAASQLDRHALDRAAKQSSNQKGCKQCLNNIQKTCVRDGLPTSLQDTSEILAWFSLLGCPTTGPLQPSQMSSEVTRDACHTKLNLVGGEIHSCRSLHALKDSEGMARIHSMDPIFNLQLRSFCLHFVFCTYGGGTVRKKDHCPNPIPDVGNRK